MAIRLGHALKELRIHLCQTSQNSRGVRDFIKCHYVDLKKENPGFPILIRECCGVQARLYARYGKGREHSVPLSDLPADKVLAAIKQLAK